MSSNEVTVGYWGIRGRAGVLRSLLAYCGIPFTNKLYSEPNAWFAKDKQELGSEYPNLPYLIDGDKTITETSAILYYIPIRAGKKELIGDTDDKFIQVQTALGVIADLKVNLVKIVTTKGDFQAEKEEGFTNGAIKSKLEVLNKNLEGKEWLTGFFSIADFCLFESLDIVHEMEASRLEKYSNLVAFYKRFSELPEYKAHRQSEQFVSLWFPPSLAWTNLKK